jgi:hypothetical protein
MVVDMFLFIWVFMVPQLLSLSAYLHVVYCDSAFVLGTCINNLLYYTVCRKMLIPQRIQEECQRGGLSKQTVTESR